MESPNHVPSADGDESIKRWTAKRRSALVLSLLRGETSVQEAARQHALTIAEIEEWRDRFLLGAENALRTKPRDEEALKDEEIKRLKQKVGELVMDTDILKAAIEVKGIPSPFLRMNSDE
jgi:transposase-like protein